MQCCASPWTEWCLHCCLGLCNSEDVSGYPTLKHYYYGEFVVEYDGDRVSEDFILFMEDPPLPYRPKEQKQIPDTPEKPDKPDSKPEKPVETAKQDEAEGENEPQVATTEKEQSNKDEL